MNNNFTLIGYIKLFTCVKKIVQWSASIFQNKTMLPLSVRGITTVDQLKNTFLYNISKYGGIKYPLKSLYEPV